MNRLYARIILYHMIIYVDGLSHVEKIPARLCLGSLHAVTATQQGNVFKIIIHRNNKICGSLRFAEHSM